MRIDASRFTLFWGNPEKYRLREIFKLAPVEPSAGSFASLLTYGRRRGTAFHELLDAQYRGVSEFAAIEDLKAGGFDEKVIATATRMARAVQARYTDLKILAHEVLFEAPIPDSPHSLVGRIDHIISYDGHLAVGDYKTTKQRTKKEMRGKAEDYCRSVQVPFYLVGAQRLGFDTRDFLYRLVVDSEPVEIQEHWTSRTGLELKEFQRAVHQTCELILWMKREFGTERPWPQLPDRFSDEYAPLMGHRQYAGVIPDGYQPKREHLSLMEE